MAMAAVTPGEGDEGAARQGDQEGRRSAARAAFQRRVAMGEYRELFDEPVRAILAQAGRSAGLAQEMGALRYVLARVLAEEEDPVRQALGVSRLTSAAARVARVREKLGEAPEGGLQRILMGMLIEADAEKDEAEEIARAEREVARLRGQYGNPDPFEFEG